MGVLDSIEKLRQKPKEVRVQVSFLTAVCVTGVVALLWGATLPMRLDATPGTVADAAEQEEMDSFFDSARANLGQLISSGAPEGKVEAEAAATSPSGAYRAGAPENAAEYSDPYGAQNREPVVTPVDKREVLIGTTTSSRR